MADNIEMAMFFASHKKTFEKIISKLEEDPSIIDDVFEFIKWVKENGNDFVVQFNRIDDNTVFAADALNSCDSAMSKINDIKRTLQENR